MIEDLAPHTESNSRKESPGEDPRWEYHRRLERRRAEAGRYARRADAIGNGRLAIFLVGAAMAGMSTVASLFSPGWLGVPLLLFLVLVVAHQQATRQRRRAIRAAEFYEQGLRRLDDRWAGTGVTGARFTDPLHPYSGDLDLFGRGSLFELLCTARTQVGEDCLAAWLCAPAAPPVIRARQNAVLELRPRLDLREDLAILGEEIRPRAEAARTGIDLPALAAWGAAPMAVAPRKTRVAAAALAGGAVLALAAWALGFGPLPFYALLLLGQALAWTQRERVRQAVRLVEKSGRDLELLSLLLSRLEREPFSSGHLRQLSAALHDRGGRPPSAIIADLHRLIDLLQAQQNQLFAPIGMLLLWTTQWAFAIQAWRAEHGARIEEWLRVIGEFEALGALASYAYERPQDPFPEIVDGGACMEAKGLGHPLLPSGASVRNDLDLGEEKQLWIVSGSNMSGKSTWLRTVGTNAVLALAGAPVRAERLRLSPLRIGASLRTQDSLQSGVSRFYAEISRLRQVVDLAGGEPPLLFLLDEILHGTNSHDRRIGAEAVVRALVRRGAIGLVTTHDLALTRIASDPHLRAGNAHFADQLDDGKMTFDYHLRPGVVEKSNALALMRAVGLEV